MTTEYERIKAEAAALSKRERAALAHDLVAGLDSEDDGDVERAWLEEAEQRYADYRAGRVEALDGDAVMKQARDTLA